MEISHEMKRYILVAIAGIAIAAYIVPTTGWLDLNSAFAGGNHKQPSSDSGDTECEGGDGGDGGDGGVNVATIDQAVEQTTSDEYGNIAVVSQDADVDQSADGGDGGDGGDAESDD
jgi:hypothetical protein